jgi:hypothetical protein
MWKTWQVWKIEAAGNMTHIALWTIVGTIASIAGLGVSLYVLRVAKGARKAARDARVVAQRTSLVEELEQAQKNAGQVGDYLNKREWMAVRIRAEEIMMNCNRSLTRWPTELSEARKNDLLIAAQHFRSIASEAATSEVGNFKPAKLRLMSDAQLSGAELLSGALGEAHNRAERDGE